MYLRFTIWQKNKDFLNWNRSVRYLIFCLARNLKDFSGICDLKKLILAISCHRFLTVTSHFEFSLGFIIFPSILWRMFFDIARSSEGSAVLKYVADRELNSGRPGFLQIAGLCDIITYFNGKRNTSRRLRGSMTSVVKYHFVFLKVTQQV